uniref:Putative secreted protein n=1 Tax=Anopheles triannulatus TaxID=58253 RepID=A0A2M4B2B4_9DIPT
MVKMLFLSAILLRRPLVLSSEFIAMPESWSSSSVDTFSVFEVVDLLLVPEAVGAGCCGCCLRLAVGSVGFAGVAAAAAAATAGAADESTILICTLLSRLTMGGVSGYR